MHTLLTRLHAVTRKLVLHLCVLHHVRIVQLNARSQPSSFHWLTHMRRGDRGNLQKPRTIRERAKAEEEMESTSCCGVSRVARVQPSQHDEGHDVSGVLQFGEHWWHYLKMFFRSGICMSQFTIQFCGSLRTGDIDWLDFWEKAKTGPWGALLACTVA